MLWLWWMLNMGCVPHQPTPTPPPVDLTPVLPSPEGSRYVTGNAEPKDPIVASMVALAGLPWRETLSGTAAHVVMQEPFAVDLAVARWGAVRAGYPHPIYSITHGVVPINTTPDSLIATLQQTLQPGDELGLVRYRIGTGDRWIAIIGHPTFSLPALPREYQNGDVLTVASTGHWRLHSPSGGLLEGVLPLEMALEEDGEWWLELRNHVGGDADVSVPLYVGMPTPPAPILSLPGQRVDTPSQALEQAYAGLGDIRSAFDRSPLIVDETLETLAQYPLQLGVGEQRDESDGVGRLRAAGFIGGPAGQVYCEGQTVVLCLDSLMWDIDSREAMLEPGMRLVGGAAEVRTDRIALLLNLASE